MEWLSVGQISEQLDIPAETIRRYINRHHIHLQVKKVHKAHYVASTSIEVLAQIRNLYKEGKQRDEVSDYLDRVGIPMHIVVVETNDYETGTIASLDAKINRMSALLISIDERLKANEGLKESLSYDFEQIRADLDVVKNEVAVSLADQLVQIEEKVTSHQEHLQDKLDQVLSRVEKYAQKKSPWWKFW